jgi:DNA-binding beta-propeller fold protein YncE
MAVGVARAQFQPAAPLPVLTIEGRESIALSGRAPQGLDVDLETGLVYVSNNGSYVAACKGTGQGVDRSMSIVDPALRRETVRIDNMGGPVWPLVDVARNVVYSANSGGKSLTVHERGTGRLLSTIPLGGRPHQAGLDPGGSLLVVTNSNDESQTFVAIVDADARAVVRHLPVSPLPHGVSVDADRHRAYVSSVGDGTNTLIDLNDGTVAGMVQQTTSGHPNANMNAFSRTLRRLFISDTPRITVVDADTGLRVGAISFGSPAWGMQVDEATGLLYAALPDQNAIGVADAVTLAALALVRVDDCPFAVRLDTVRRTGFSTGMNGNRLTMFPLERVEAALGR